MTPEELDHMRKVNQQIIEMGDRLTRLEANDDFIQIRDNYIEKEPIRLTKLLADPTLNMSDKAELHRREITETLIGISRFASYLRYIKLLADRAKKQLEELNTDNESVITES